MQVSRLPSNLAARPSCAYAVPSPAFALTLCAVLLQSTKSKGGSYLITVEDLVMQGVYGSGIFAPSCVTSIMVFRAGTAKVGSPGLSGGYRKGSAAMQIASREMFVGIAHCHYSRASTL